MSDAARVRALLAPFAERSVDLEGREFKVDRGAAVGIILSAVRQQPAPTRAGLSWPLVLAGGLAAAAAALLFVTRQAPTAQAGASVVKSVTGIVTHRQGAAVRTLAPSHAPQKLVGGGELLTGPGATAHLGSETGTELALLENSRVTLHGFDHPAGSVQLLAGSIRCEVPQLPPGEGFSVWVAQGGVELRGSAFVAFVSGFAEASQPCITVERGEAVVKSTAAEHLVMAGQSWGCGAEPALEPAVVEPEPVANSSLLPNGTPRQFPSSRTEGRVKAGTLDEENRLFQAGLAAERRQDPSGAKAAFDDLLGRFPSSPLANDVRVARARSAQTRARGP